MAQIRWEALVRDRDPSLPTLLEWQRKIEASYAKDGRIRPDFGSWSELPFDTLKRLFPGLRFFTNAWLERAVPGKGRVSGLGGGEYTLVCDSKGKLVAEIYHYGNYESFGEILATNKIALRSPEDAKLVWDAFCDVHQKHWKDQPAIRVSDTVWHLGDTTIERFHYYYEVRLNDDQTVRSAKLHAVETKTPEAK